MSRSSRISKHIRSLTALAGLCGLAACADPTTGPAARPAVAGPSASGGISGGGGGVQVPSVAGNWVGSISTPFGVGAFTLRLGVSGTTVSGSAHFGAPIFDSTLHLAGSLTSASQFSGVVYNGDGNLPITGTLSADGTTLSGTVVQGATYTYVVTRQ